MHISSHSPQSQPIQFVPLFTPPRTTQRENYHLPYTVNTQATTPKYQTQPVQTRLQLPPQIHLQAMISTENVEYSPDRFISRIKAQLEQERQKNQQLEQQLMQKQISLPNPHEQVHQLQQQLKEAYNMIDELQDHRTSKIRQLQDRHKIQVDSLLNQIEQSNKILQKYKEAEDKRKNDRYSSESSDSLLKQLKQKQQENDDLRAQLLVVHQEFKRVNELISELVQENNQLQTQCRPNKELEKIVFTLREENSKKEEEIRQLRSKLYQNDQSFQQSDGYETLRQKRISIQKLQDECKIIKDQLQNPNQQYNEVQLMELKFKYDILQGKINYLQYDIVSMYSNQENN